MDAALPTGKFPAYTTQQLLDMLTSSPAEVRAVMEAEIERRAAVAAGDVSRMSPSERLRHARNGEPRS